MSLTSETGIISRIDREMRHMDPEERAMLARAALHNTDAIAIIPGEKLLPRSDRHQATLQLGRTAAFASE